VTLVLQAVDVRGPSRWRWLLTDEATGNPLADHQVELDADEARLRAFGDVFGYVSSYAAPDQWDGDSALDPGQFLAALTGWTVTALHVLSPAARLMAQFVACLEDGDRRSDVIEATWADLWQRLGRPGDPPPPGPLLDAMARAALVQPEDGTPVAYRVHPGVAAAIIAAADPGIRDAVDAGLAAFWAAVSRQAREGEGGEDSGLVVAAGLAAAPYLLRRADWDTTADPLEDALMRGPPRHPRPRRRS
jgi:hypothetical protein